MPPGEYDHRPVYLVDMPGFGDGTQLHRLWAKGIEDGAGTLGIRDLLEPVCNRGGVKVHHQSL